MDYCKLCYYAKESIYCDDCVGYNNFRESKERIGIMKYHQKLPWVGIEYVACTMREGEKEHGLDEWKKKDKLTHMQHAATHMIKAFKLHFGENKYKGIVIEDEDHLAHAATRLLMALERREQ